MGYPVSIIYTCAVIGPVIADMERGGCCEILQGTIDSVHICEEGIDEFEDETHIQVHMGRTHEEEKKKQKIYLPNRSCVSRSESGSRSEKVVLHSPFGRSGERILDARHLKW